MEPFPLDEQVWLCDTAVFLPKEKTLVISDLQLGQEQQLRARGHNILYQERERMMKKLEGLLKRTHAARLVIAGDLKHEFGRISAQERRDILQLLTALKHRIEVIVVEGNHDTITKPLTDEAGLPFVRSWSADGIFVIHGHELPDEKDAAFRGASTIIIGHLHPAITLTDGVRAEKAKCFLVGKYGKRRLIVLPSFAGISDGSDVLQYASNTPLLKELSLSQCEVYVMDAEVRHFGSVKQLRQLLNRFVH